MWANPLMELIFKTVSSKMLKPFHRFLWSNSVKRLSLGCGVDRETKLDSEPAEATGMHRPS